MVADIPLDMLLQMEVSKDTGYVLFVCLQIVQTVPAHLHRSGFTLKIGKISLKSCVDIDFSIYVL